MPATAAISSVLERQLLLQLGHRLKAARKSKGLTSAEVAAAAGLSRMTLNAIESGEPSPTMGNYVRVMGALGFGADLALLANTAPPQKDSQTAAVPGSAPVSVSYHQLQDLQSLALHQEAVRLVKRDDQLRLKALQTLDSLARFSGLTARIGGSCLGLALPSSLKKFPQSRRSRPVSGLGNDERGNARRAGNQPCCGGAPESKHPILQIRSWGIGKARVRRRVRRASVKGCQTRLAVRRGVPSWGVREGRRAAQEGSYPRQKPAQSGQVVQLRPVGRAAHRPLRGTRGNQYGQRPAHLNCRAQLASLGARERGGPHACSSAFLHARSTAQPQPRGTAAAGTRAGGWRASDALESAL